MRRTPNFNFELPDYDDFYDVEVMNRNFEILDRILKGVVDDDRNT